MGLFTVKSANQVIMDAKNRPPRRRLFGQLWYEGENCILYSDTNLGKTILAVQIADSISSGRRATLGLAMDARRKRLPTATLSCLKCSSGSATAMITVMIIRSRRIYCALRLTLTLTVLTDTALRNISRCLWSSLLLITG